MACNYISIKLLYTERKRERKKERDAVYCWDNRTWEMGRKYNLQSPGGWPHFSLIFKLHGLVKPFAQPGPFSQFSDEETEGPEVMAMFALCPSFLFSFAAYTLFLKWNTRFFSST